MQKKNKNKFNCKILKTINNYYFSCSKTSSLAAETTAAAAAAESRAEYK